MVQKDKMYAHVYFNIPNNSLGIAVYALGKIPGFSGVLSDELRDMTDTRKAYDLFLKTLGGDEISKEELQQGRIFQYNRLEEKLNTLDILGKLIAKDKEAQVTVDLDDPMTWLDLYLQNLSEEKQYVVKNLPEEQKLSLGNKLRQSQMLEGLSQIESTEQLRNELQKIFTSVSRHMYPGTGAKDFPGTKKYPSPTPPTFLVSKEYDFAYYPGFRGAHYMTMTPQSDRYVHPHAKGTPSEEKWMLDIIPDTTQYLNRSLSAMDVNTLDNITESLARIFYQNLRGTSFADFQKASAPVKSKAEDLLMQIVESTNERVASSKVGTWIDLQSGATYSSEQELLSAMNSQEDSEEERLPLAAKLRIRKLARHLLRNRNLEAFCKLMRQI